MKKYKVRLDRMFSGDLFFLSKDYPCPITLLLNGKSYRFPNMEAAYQAGKYTRPKEIKKFTKVKDGEDARALSECKKERNDWNTVKEAWMEKVLECKFMQHPDLMEKLLDTYPLTLKDERKPDGDLLGILLIKLRNEYRQEEIPEKEIQLIDITRKPR